MNMKRPEPFMFEEGERAVLLLHGFTGHSGDVRMLGRYLQRKGYTTYAPIYRGHGKGPENLTEGSKEAWWEDVKEAYQFLRNKGYDKIAVAGLSLGGVLSLKLTYNAPVKGVVTMCTPIILDENHRLDEGFRYYATQYKKSDGIAEDEIKGVVDKLVEKSAPLFTEISELIIEVKGELETIYTPTFVVQAKDDHIINTDSANHIYDTVECDDKEIKWYEEAGHAITLGPKKAEVHEDIYNFLESLNWD